jgi:hypothetical protein
LQSRKDQEVHWAQGWETHTLEWIETQDFFTV